VTDAVETDEAPLTSAFQDVLVSSLPAIVRVAAEAMVCRVMLPGQNLRVGSEAYLSSNAANVMTSGASSLVQFGKVRTAVFDTVSGGDDRPEWIDDGGPSS